MMKLMIVVSWTVCRNFIVLVEVVTITEELYSLVFGRILNCLPRLLLLCVSYFVNLGSPCIPPSCCSFWPCWLRQLVVGFSLPSPRFFPMPAHVDFLIGSILLQQVYLSTGFPLSLPFYR